MGVPRGFPRLGDRKIPSDPELGCSHFSKSGGTRLDVWERARFRRRLPGLKDAWDGNLRRVQRTFLTCRFTLYIGKEHGE